MSGGKRFRRFAGGWLGSLLLLCGIIPAILFSPVQRSTPKSDGSGQVIAPGDSLRQQSQARWRLFSAFQRRSFSSQANQPTGGVPQFFDTPTYPVGRDGGAIASADFNGDGIPDIAVVTNNGVSVLLGNGDGTFQAHKDSVASSGMSIASGDFNGDGKTDLALLTCTTNVCLNYQISVLLGNGDGTFQTPVNYPVSGNDMLGSSGLLAVADLNGDGKLDLAVGNNYCIPHCQGSSTVSVLLGNGDGTFQPHTDYATGPNPIAVVVADLNGDSKPDLAVLGYDDGLGDPSTLYVLLGNGDGTFQPYITSQAGKDGGGLAIADLNGSGKLDAVLACADSTVLVLMGNGDGTFRSPIAYGNEPDGVPPILADFNADGRLDVGFANRYGVGVLFGNGDGTFGKESLSGRRALLLI